MARLSFYVAKKPDQVSGFLGSYQTSFHLLFQVSCDTALADGLGSVKIIHYIGKPCKFHLQ